MLELPVGHVFGGKWDAFVLCPLGEVVPLVVFERREMLHELLTQHAARAPQDAYQASKGAILSLSKSLAIQFGPDRIRSNALLPGPTLTPMQQRWERDEETQKAIADSVPLKRIGTPQDMANACAFLLSDDASFITGTELIVDGGLMARP